MTRVQKKVGSCHPPTLPGTFYFCHSNQCNAIIIILVNIHYHHITIIIHMHRQVLKHNGAQCPFSGACFKIHILAQNYIGAKYQFAIFFIKNLVPYMHRQVLKHNGAQCPFSGACFKIHTILVVCFKVFDTRKE